MAEKDGEAVGCVALIAMDDGGFEVAKMTVSEAPARRGPRPAADAALHRRRRPAGARRLYLETNSSLAPALGLYRAMGFTDLPPTDAPLRARRRLHGAAVLSGPP